jgi:hypothetical protein
MAPRERREARFLERLTLVSMIVGELSTLSYALSAPTALRSVNPSLGAWWDAYQFYFMEGAATALGLLIGIRIGRRFVPDVRRRSRSLILALVLAIVGFAPVLHVCAAAARLGWSASDGTTLSPIVDLAGYAAARQIDKILIASVYFVKIVSFALLAGLALIAVAVVPSLMTSERGPGAPAEPTKTGRDAVS